MSIFPYLFQSVSFILFKIYVEKKSEIPDSFQLQKKIDKIHILCHKYVRKKEMVNLLFLLFCCCQTLFMQIKMSCVIMLLTVLDLDIPEGNNHLQFQMLFKNLSSYKVFLVFASSSTHISCKTNMSESVKFPIFLSSFFALILFNKNYHKNNIQFLGWKIT